MQQCDSKITFLFAHTQLQLAMQSFN